MLNTIYLQAMVEVFITNVHEQAHALQLVALFNKCFPGRRVNFDLEDCDRVLRIEGASFQPLHIVSLMQEHGFECSIME